MTEQESDEGLRDGKSGDWPYRELTPELSWNIRFDLEFRRLEIDVMAGSGPMVVHTMVLIGEDQARIVTERLERATDELVRRLELRKRRSE
jgi:hypothetical protein